MKQQDYSSQILILTLLIALGIHLLMVEKIDWLPKESSPTVRKVRLTFAAAKSKVTKSPTTAAGTIEKTNKPTSRKPEVLKKSTLRKKTKERKVVKTKMAKQVKVATTAPIKKSVPVRPRKVVEKKVPEKTTKPIVAKKNPTVKRIIKPLPVVKKEEPKSKPVTVVKKVKKAAPIKKMVRPPEKIQSKPLPVKTVEPKKEKKPKPVLKPESKEQPKLLMAADALKQELEPDLKSQPQPKRLMAEEASEQKLKPITTSVKKAESPQKISSQDETKIDEKIAEEVIEPEPPKPGRSRIVVTRELSSLIARYMGTVDLSRYYSRSMRRRRIQGTVKVELRFSKSGTMTDYTILRKEQSKLNRSVVRLVEEHKENLSRFILTSKWKNDSDANSFRIVIPIRFSLKRS